MAGPWTFNPASKDIASSILVGGAMIFNRKCKAQHWKLQCVLAKNHIGLHETSDGVGWIYDKECDCLTTTGPVWEMNNGPQEKS